MAGSTFTLGVVQCALNDDRSTNVERVARLVREAAARGANVIVTPELFEGPYFCRQEREEFFEWARPAVQNATIDRFSSLAKELDVVLPVSFFERHGQVYYNSVAVLDADGSQLGVYRKSHIPDGPGYEEKFYFRPGDTGFKIWHTRHGVIGVGICWDQWFPECARAMTLMGAEALLYPSAIGSEPEHPDLDTKDPWQRAMIGHAVSNAIPVAASNRIGREETISFYGASFIASQRGDRVAELDREEGVAVASFDRTALQRYRDAFGFFRDRRPDLYDSLLTTDGTTTRFK
jgi:N-carbamoylputrescine amidase